MDGCVYSSAGALAGLLGSLGPEQTFSVACRDDLCFVPTRHTVSVTVRVPDVDWRVWLWRCQAEETQKLKDMKIVDVLWLLAGHGVMSSHTTSAE